LGKAVALNFGKGRLRLKSPRGCWRRVQTP